MVCHTLGVDKIWHGRKPKTDIIDNMMQYLNSITTHNISSASQHFLKPRHKILIRIGVKCGVHELLSTAFGAFDWVSPVSLGFCRTETDEPKTKNPIGALTTFDDLLSISATQNTGYWPHRLDFENIESVILRVLNFLAAVLPSTLPRRNSTQCVGVSCCTCSEHCEAIAQAAQDLCKSTPTQALKDYHEFKLEGTPVRLNPTNKKKQHFDWPSFQEQKALLQQARFLHLQDSYFSPWTGCLLRRCIEQMPHRQGQVAWRCRSRPSRPVFIARSVSKRLSSEGVSRSTTGTWWSQNLKIQNDQINRKKLIQNTCPSECCHDHQRGTKNIGTSVHRRFELFHQQQAFISCCQW